MEPYKNSKSPHLMGIYHVSGPLLSAFHRLTDLILFSILITHSIPQQLSNLGPIIIIPLSQLRKQKD